MIIIKRINTKQAKKSWSYVFICLFIISTLTLGFIAGYYVSKVFNFKEITSFYNLAYNYSINYMKGLVAEGETLELDIKQKDYDVLSQMRQKAISKGILSPSEEVYVDTKVKFKGISYDAKVRLKGDIIDHIESNQWSLRIELKGDKAILGMNKFSIQHPKMRNYMYELLLHQMLDDNEILTPKYGFLSVKINGKANGVYAIEEHFGKLFIEQKKYKYTPIVKFDEEMYIDNFIVPNGKQITTYKFLEQYETDYLSKNAVFLPIEKKILKDSISKKLYEKASNLLYGFFEGKLPVDKVFNINKLANFMAILDVMSSQHSAECHNLRFYVNPYNSLIEPIGYDGEPLFERKTLTMRMALGDETYDFTPAHKRLFTDTVFVKKYIEALGKLSSSSYLTMFTKKNERLFDSSLAILSKSFPHISYSTLPIIENQKYIRTLIHPNQALNSFVKQVNNSKIILRVSNFQMFPVEILGIYERNKKISRDRIVIMGKKNAKELDYIDYNFNISKNVPSASNDSLFIEYCILGTNKKIVSKINSYVKEEIEKFQESDFWLSNNFNYQKKNILYRIDKLEKKIIFEKPVCKINRDIILPRGYKVIIKEGVTIDLINNATIVSLSPIYLLGRKENPIKFMSTDNTGQGLAVIEANEKSYIKYTQFNNQSSPNKIGWSLTASMTFYKSDVDISESTFTRNHCEDALNIVHSKFYLRNSFFYNTYSDAFDGDFVKGNIINCRFENLGNDAVDFSGSNIKIQKMYVNKAGDKGISVGENSQVEAFNVIVENSEIGLASKDKSFLYVENSTVKKCSLAAAVYNKKTEFGPAIIEILNSQIENRFLIEDKSHLTLNYIKQVNLDNLDKNIKNRLYGNEFGKQSR